MGGGADARVISESADFAVAARGDSTEDTKAATINTTGTSRSIHVHARSDRAVLLLTMGA